MEFLSVRDFNASPKRTREKLDRDGKLILTNHGKPMALVLRVTPETFEDTLEAARQMESLQMLKAMRAEAGRKGYLTDEEIQAEIDASRAEAVGRKREA